MMTETCPDAAVQRIDMQHIEWSTAPTVDTSQVVAPALPPEHAELAFAAL